MTYKITIPAGTKLTIPTIAKVDMGIAPPGTKNVDIVNKPHFVDETIGKSTYEARGGKDMVLTGQTEAEMKRFKPFEKSHGLKFEEEK